jgi:hypothetical protein
MSGHADTANDLIRHQLQFLCLNKYSHEIMAIKLRTDLGCTNVGHYATKWCKSRRWQDGKLVAAGNKTVAKWRQQHRRRWPPMLAPVKCYWSANMNIRTRLFTLLLTNATILIPATANAAEIHARQFLSPQGQVIASTMLTADCHYRDTTGVRQLQSTPGSAGKHSCVAPSGMRVATFTPQELYAEQFSQKAQGGIVLRLADGRTWHSRTRAAAVPQNSPARYACSPCVQAMPSICCPRHGA